MLATISRMTAQMIITTLKRSEIATACDEAGSKI
jgi:hypothetical protein